MVVYGLSAFCSNEHFYAHQNEPSAPKPKKNKVRTDELPPRVREAVVERDRGCVLCGGQSDLAVHHINYRSEMKGVAWLHQTHNLVTLCNYPCHISTIHGDKRRWKPLCLGYIWMLLIEEKRMRLEDVERMFS